MKSDILVMGALGNVGAEVTKNLLAQGLRVRAADLDVDKLRARFGDGIDPVYFDFRQPQTFLPTFQGIQRIFLMRPPQIANIRKDMIPALEAARAAGVRQMVFLSIIGVENNKIVPHYQVEQWLKASGLDYTLLRCSFFMQNFTTTHRAEIRDRDEIYIPVGEARTSLIDVRDVGAVASLALSTSGHEKQAYDLTGSEALDYYQVAEQFSQVLGRTITYKNPTAIQFFWHQLKHSYALPYAAVTTWLYTNTRNGMASRVTGKVEHLLGRKPISMRQYIEDFQESWVR